MTKIRKLKRGKKFQVNQNRKRLRNKLNKLPSIQCKEIKNAWEVKKSLKGNLREMGLIADPNEVIKTLNSRKGAPESVIETVATEKFFEEDCEIKKPSKIYVAESLEKEAKAPRERMFKLPQSQVEFITYMMDKYEDNYKAMMKDKKNIYQLTWRQIRAKINSFKNIPEQYAEYLVEKGEIVLDDPTPLSETKKQRALENFQKHCVSKKPKKVLKLSTGWEEESIEPVEGIAKTISDVHMKDSTTEEKLNNFRDEGSDSESELKMSSIKKQGTVDVASNGILQYKSKTSKKTNKKSKNESCKSLEKDKGTKKRMAEDENKITKKAKRLEKSVSSDSECEDELEGEENNSGFVNLSDLSSEELSDDDILDDGEFVTDSEDEDD